MKIFGGLLIASIALGGCVNRDAQQQAKRTEAILNDKTPVVVVQPAREETILEEATITGQMTSSDDTIVGARIVGRLTMVTVRDGDFVSAGQVVAQQETSSLSAQLRQAEGAASSARAQLSQALSQKISRPKQSEEAIKVAEAQLRAARAQLAKVKRGARKEELRQAEIQVQTAKSNLETARLERDRQKALFDEGATSRQRYEQAENAYQQALGAYESAVELYRLRQTQVEPEDIQSAEEAVRQAEAAVRNAKATKELDVTLGQQVSAAQANVRSAEAAVDMARQAVADATIRSPFSGRVSGKPAQVGTVLGPGSAVLRLIGDSGIYFEGNVPETLIADVLPGKPVVMTLNALPGREFSGLVAAINPQGEAMGRLFKVRITVTEGGEELKAGMFAQGRIRLKEMPQAVTVPTAAILTESGESFVFIVQGEKAARRTVKKGVAKGERTQVTGISAGTMVIIRGQSSVKDGQAVRKEQASAAAKKGETGG
jgi:RND family efflux transporter MFP subunit